MSATNDDVLRAVQGVASEQGRVAAALEGHVALDNERFKGVNDKLDKIDARTEQTAAGVQSLKDARNFNRGRAWAFAKILGMAALIASVAEVALTWARAK